MTEALLYFLTLIISAAGFMLLAASQRQHRAVIARCFAVLNGPARILRWMGIALLCASLGLAAARDGVAFGFVVWTLTITISAFAVAAALTLLGWPAAGTPQAGDAENESP